MRKLMNEQGFVLVSAIIMTTVLLGLGLGLLLFTDSQQKASGREQASESAFNVAEAALNAQLGQISRKWPGSEKQELLPYRCTASEGYSAANDCPTPESLKIAYPNNSPLACSTGTPKDAWGSPMTNQWATYVRADKEGTSLFNSASEAAEPTYDTGSGKLWIRAVGVAQCRLVSIITLVSKQEVPANLPRDAMSANWFTTGNQGSGRELIVDLRGKASQPGEVRARCAGFKGTEAEIKEKCAKWSNGQVEPEEDVKAPAAATPALTASQLEALKQQAEWQGTYYPSGRCPPEGLPTGKVVFVEGPCNISARGVALGNSEAKPGVLLIMNGTFEMAGNAEFWGVVYLADKQESSEEVARITGNAQLHGELLVEGNGGIGVGQSHKKNLEFDPRAAIELTTYAGATSTRNTFRVLPITQ